MCLHACVHLHTCLCALTHVPADSHTCLHTLTDTRIHLNTHIHTCTRMCLRTHVYLRVRALVCTHAHMHSCVAQQGHTCVCRHALVHAHPRTRHQRHGWSPKTHVCTCVHKYMCAKPRGPQRRCDTHVHALNLARACTHTRIHTRAHPDSADRDTHPHVCTCTAPPIQACHPPSTHLGPPH